VVAGQRAAALFLRLARQACHGRRSLDGGERCAASLTSRNRGICVWRNQVRGVGDIHLGINSGKAARRAMAARRRAAPSESWRLLAPPDDRRWRASPAFLNASLSGDAFYGAVRAARAPWHRG